VQKANTNGKSLIPVVALARGKKNARGCEMNKHTRSVSLIDGHTEDITDAEIIKALECCISSNTSLACFKCPMVKNKECNGSNTSVNKLVVENALDLINRQQAEIEKLNVELVGMRGACESYKIHYDNAQAEIERLKAEQEMADGYEDALVEMTKSEAIKEFWKRFDKVLCENIGPSKRVYWEISSDGNNLVKEMTEVSENG
jgi:hypothetical protein